MKSRVVLSEISTWCRLCMVMFLDRRKVHYEWCHCRTLTSHSWNSLKSCQILPWYIREHSKICSVNEEFECHFRRLFIAQLWWKRSYRLNSCRYCMNYHRVVAIFLIFATFSLLENTFQIMLVQEIRGTFKCNFHI